MSNNRKTAKKRRSTQQSSPSSIKVMNALVQNPGTGTGGQSDNSIQRIYRSETKHTYKEVRDRVNVLFPKDSILQQIISAPINDGLSEWRKVSQELAAIEKTLEYQRTFMEAGIKARLFGQSLIVPVLDGGNGARVALNRTLDRAVADGASIKRLMVASEFEEAENLVTDTFSDYHGRPVYYKINNVRVHHSRVIPVFANQSKTSVFESIENSLSMFHLGRIDVSRAVQEANFLVLKTDFVRLQEIVDSKNIAQGSDEDLYDHIRARLRNLRCNGNNNGAYAIDVNFEDLVNIQKANIDDMVKALDQMAQFLAGDADIPMSRLFAKGQAGLSNSTRADIENYIQSIKGTRFMVLQPSVNELDRFIKRFNTDLNTDYEWNPVSVERYLETPEVNNAGDE